jgi:hypothetical protein
LLGFVFHHQDEGEMFLRNVALFSNGLYGDVFQKTELAENSTLIMQRHTLGTEETLPSDRVTAYLDRGYSWYVFGAAGN